MPRPLRTDTQKSLLDSWPLDIPKYYSTWVNERETEDGLGKLRVCVNRGQPFGSQAWTEYATKFYGLESTVRPRGRPSAIRKGS